MKVAWLVACCSSLARLPASPILIPTYVTQHENENGGLFAVESWLYNTIAVNKSTLLSVQHYYYMKLRVLLGNPAADKLLWPHNVVQ